MLAARTAIARPVVGARRVQRASARCVCRRLGLRTAAGCIFRAARPARAQHARWRRGRGALRPGACADERTVSSPLRCCCSAAGVTVVAREAAWSPGSDAPAWLNGTLAGDFGAHTSVGMQQQTGPGYRDRRGSAGCANAACAPPPTPAVAADRAAAARARRAAQAAALRRATVIRSRAALGAQGPAQARRLRSYARPAGFDPMGLGKDADKLKWYQQAELQHCRWASACPPAAPPCRLRALLALRRRTA